MDAIQNILIKDDEVKEIPCLLLGIGVTLLFEIIILGMFFYINQRIFEMLGGNWPDGIVQSATYLAFFWALFILLGRWFLYKERLKAFHTHILPQEEEQVILSEDVGQYRRNIQMLMATEQQRPLIQWINKALLRFKLNQSVEEVSQLIQYEREMSLNHLDNSLSTVRYLAWAIPSIGFIGTVLGIGAGLGNINEGKAAVVAKLNVAFDTTLVALILSLFLMLVLHYIQREEEAVVLKQEAYCMQYLVNRLYIPKSKV